MRLVVQMHDDVVDIFEDVCEVSVPHEGGVTVWKHVRLNIKLVLFGRVNPGPMWQQYAYVPSIEEMLGPLTWASESEEDTGKPS